MAKQFDVAVIGAGAAGMMCAAVAAQQGKRVVVIDQHHALALLGGHSRTHHAGRARADHCHIKLFCHKNSGHR